MNIHVLAGGRLAENLRANIGGELIVCRECLIAGDVKAENLNDFWKIRADYIKTAYGETEEKYFQNVSGELSKLKNLAPRTEVHLWFEYELFCQTNMWFCLDLLSKTQASSIYRVAPVTRKDNEIWKGFGNLSAEDLQKCFAQKIKFEKEDITLGVNLWKAYQNSEHEKLERLAETKSECFPFKEVCRAEIEKDFRPKSVLQEITGKGATDFAEIYPEFSRRAGVYGFGDSQVKQILQKL